MKIDSYAHIITERYLAALIEKGKVDPNSRQMKNPPAFDLGVRLRLMERYPDVVQILTHSDVPLKAPLTPAEEIDVCRMANDQMTDLVLKYPDKFIAAVATLPLGSMAAALEETDRAITQLGMKGIQLYASAAGERLDDPKWRPLFERMVKYDLPVWIHPAFENEPVFGWPYATAVAMNQLVCAGIFAELPGIKFITHHCGAMAPFHAGRIDWIFTIEREVGNPARKWGEHFRRFYADTATCGSIPALMCGRDFFGVDHIVFATDAPLGPYGGLTAVTIRSVEQMDIPDEEKEKIFTWNIANLLGLSF
jgi:uncharacterized protein